MKKILLIDGNSMIFRAYYATMRQPMNSKSGQPTNAVFGFSNMLSKAMSLIEPDYCLVAFDTAKKTFRHDKFENYKGTRKPLDHDLISQFPLVREFLSSYPLAYKELEGYEADDIIGTLSKQFDDYKKVILTSDKDMLQLIKEDTSVLLMKKGITEMQEVTLEVLADEFKLIPDQVKDLKALMGDASDNIPGVPGVGEKTAMNLIEQFQHLDAIYDNIDQVKGKLKEKLLDNKEIAYLSKDLATIFTEVPIDFDIDSWTIDMDPTLISKFYRKYDMNSLLKKVEIQSEEKQSDFSVLAFDQSFVKDDVIIMPKISRGSGFSVVVDGYYVSDPKHVAYIDRETSLSDPQFKALVEGNFSKKSVDGKNLFHALKADGFVISDFVDDLLILTYLCDSTISSLDKLKDKHDLWNHDLDENSKQLEFIQQSHELFEDYHHQLENFEMVDLYEDIELPLLEILVDMERVGIKVDKEALLELAKDTSEKVNALSDQIYKLAGHEFNINSPKQLGTILFDELGLKTSKKRSTAVDVLEKLVNEHEIIEKILEYRKYQKFLSTYAEGLQKYISEDGRIHTNYSQSAAQTGRLSSLDPNLQNISVRNEETKIVRKVFVADEDMVLLSCDYSQIELRVLAHMADEKEMIDAFNHDLDIHTKTAMEVFEVDDPLEVTSLMRRQAKAVNFGIVYGISDFGLSQQLDITPSKANEFIKNYLETFSGISEYMENIVEFCQEHGYVKTLFNRRRLIPEINDKNFVVKDRAKRAAMNSPIQGTAADLIKIAMIKVSDNLKKMKVKSKMILQVHDELLLLVAKDEVDKVSQMVVESMRNVADLKVALDVSCDIGQNWFEV